MGFSDMPDSLQVFLFHENIIHAYISLLLARLSLISNTAQYDVLRGENV